MFFKSLGTPVTTGHVLAPKAFCLAGGKPPGVQAWTNAITGGMSRQVRFRRSRGRQAKPEWCHGLGRRVPRSRSGGAPGVI